MQPVISAAQMRQIDRLTTDNFKTPSLLLMESAANSCLLTIESHFGGNLSDKKALVLCGKGNNGGDGAALARGLSRTGVNCDVVLFGTLPEISGDAQANLEAVARLASFEAGSAIAPAPMTFVECDSVSSWEHIARPRRTYDLIVDALFGTGLTRPLEGLFLKVIEHLEMLRNARERAHAVQPLILSIDIPSGLNADSAEPIGPAIRADLTVTFTAPKPANVLPPASEFGGRLVLSEIGSPQSLITATKSNLFLTEAADARAWLIKTRYTPESYKNTHGHVLVAAGARGYTGAAALCGNAAMRSGAGLVTIATPASAQTNVAGSAMSEVMTTPLAETDRGSVSDDAAEHFQKLTAKATAIAIGPGLTADDERTRNFVRTVVANRILPVVIDADGLNCLSPWPATLRGTDESPLILTPHPGEMMRLVGSTDPSLLNDRVALARDFAMSNRVILVLKGTRPLIAAPDGRVFINATGNAGLGTAGAGDTLTGLIVGFIAQARATLGTEADLLEATIAALYVGGLAGDFAADKIGMRTMVASDIREHFGDAIRLLDPDGERPPTIHR